MIEFFKRAFTPLALVSPAHPLFKLEKWRVRRLLSSSRLLRLTANVIGIIFLILLALWIVAVRDDMSKFGDQYQSTYYYRPPLSGSAGGLLGFVFVISIGVSGFLDFACMVAAVYGISGELITGRWDLLRLTALKDDDIVAAKHAAARLRVWRMTIGVFAIRLAVVILGIATWLVNGGLIYFELDGSQFLFYLTLLVLVALYLAEPFWRAWAQTALGLGISIRFRSSLSLNLVAIGSVIALWILQPLVIGLILWATFSALNTYSIGIFYGTDTATIYFYFLLIALYLTFIFYAFYAVIRRSALSYVITRLRQTEA